MRGYPSGWTGGRGTDWSTSAPPTSPSTAPTSATSPSVWGCDGMPDADPLPVITAVDVAEPIVVSGPATIRSTPGHHAAEMAAALGDAVAVTWEGVGHTAFPVTACLDGAVVDYLVDGAVPDDGLELPVRRRDIDRHRGRRPPLRLSVMVGAAVAGGRVRRRGRRADGPVPRPASWPASTTACSPISCSASQSPRRRRRPRPSPSRPADAAVRSRRVSRCDADRGGVATATASWPAADLLEEVVALVVDDDERREVDDLDLPHRLHAELGVLEHLDRA